MSTSKKTDLQLIKKHYSETLAHICRELFPTLLETNGLLYKIVSEHFAQSKTLGEDIEKWGEKEAFKDYIYSFVNIQKNEYLKVPEGPEELMSKAGYVLFPECKTEADIQSFRHYYYRGEPTPIYKGGRPKHWKGQEICTFDGGRLLTCRVWFAVKKEVVQNENAIPRAKSPARQDAYGTSVLSIQFSKGLFNILSIKNRYSHAVNNPDATFGNDLDNIIPGLTRAFRDKYNLKISSKVPAFVLEDYIEAPDGKYYKYNLTYSSTFYCPNNTIIKNKEVKRLPDRYYLMDGYVVDFSSNTISMYDKNVFFLYENGTTGIKNLDISGFIETEPIILPPVELVEEFDAFCHSVFDVIFANGLQNEKLANMRDALLPKLMSGEIDVSDLDL